MNEFFQQFMPLIKGFWSEYRGVIALTAVFGSLLLISWQVLVFITSRPAPKLPQKQMNNINIREYIPEITGALIGFAVMVQYPLWTLVSTWGGILLAHLGKMGYHYFYAKLTEEKRAGEILLMFEVISIYAEAGYSLYEALRACIYLVRLNSKPLQRCIRVWGQGPQRALERFAREAGITEADALVSILKRALVVGPGKLAKFLSDESHTMEKLRQMRVEQSLGVRPIIQTLYLLFPGLALLGVTLIPIGFYIAWQITSIRLN